MWAVPHCCDDVYAAVHKVLGTKGAVDLTLICSYYAGLCLAHIALKLEMESGRVSTL